MVQVEKTLVLIKPDGVQRGLCGRIIQRFEDVGLKIIGSKLVWIDKDHAGKHYFDVEDRHGQKVFEKLTTYLSSGPVMAICLEGVEACALVRKLVGSTYPGEASPGTIRGDFAHITKAYANAHDRNVGNLIHASANSKEASYELGVWFDDKELHSYTVLHESHTR